MDGASAPAPAAAPDSARYFEAITACGDKRPLVVSQPIYSSTGIKLLDKGAKFDTRILERLFGHSLAEPIDRCVASEDAVRHRDLVARARELVAATPLLAHFEAALAPQAERLWSAFAACPLPPAIAMRLTVARDTAAAVFDHSLKAAFTALFIAARARFSNGDLQTLATAALLHDLGMMHVDPALFEAETLDAAGRRSLYAHPVAGQLIAQREPLLSPAIATAIVQHHERLDGSGYPRGLGGDAIGKFARVLMLVEIVLAVLEHQRDQPDLQLSLILRLNHRSFDLGLSAVVLAALPSLKPTEGGTTGEGTKYQQAVALFDGWSRLCSQMPPPAGDAAAAFVDGRIRRLRRWLADAGLGDPDAAARAADGAPIVGAEMAGLTYEALWHVRQIAYEALHRWPELLPDAQAAPCAVREWVATALSVVGVKD